MNKNKEITWNEKNYISPLLEKIEKVEQRIVVYLVCRNCKNAIWSKFEEVEEEGKLKPYNTNDIEHKPVCNKKYQLECYCTKFYRNTYPHEEKNKVRTECEGQM